MQKIFCWKIEFCAKTYCIERKSFLLMPKLTKGYVKQIFCLCVDAKNTQLQHLYNEQLQHFSWNYPTWNECKTFMLEFLTFRRHWADCLTSHLQCRHKASCRMTLTVNFVVNPARNSMYRANWSKAKPCVVYAQMTEGFVPDLPGCLPRPKLPVWGDANIKLSH